MSLDISILYVSIFYVLYLTNQLFIALIFGVIGEMVEFYTGGGFFLIFLSRWCN